MPSHEIAILLDLIDEAYDHHSWHGTNLRGALRGLDLHTLAWRPAEGRHNIWEVAVHAAYWKYAAWRRIAGGRLGGFPLKGSNWFPRPVDGGGGTAGASLRKQDLRLLDAMHVQLRGAVAALSPRVLGEAPDGRKVSTRALVTGVAAHDLYHAGQIQLLKRLRVR